MWWQRWDSNPHLRASCYHGYPMLYGLFSPLRSTEFMSFPLCAAGLVVSCEWFLYGTLIADNFITLPNFVGVMFAVFQMALFGKFPSSRSKEPLRTASSLV
jgi:hypothetical protein